MRSLRWAATLLVVFLSMGWSADWSAEVLELERLVLENPQDGVAFHQLRNITANDGRLQEWAERWLASAEKDPAAAAMAGWTNLYERRPTEAVRWFEKSIALSPKQWHAWIGLAQAQYDAKAPDAKGSAREAAARAQTDEQLKRAIWLVIHASGTGSREALINEADALPPDKMWLLAAEAAQARRLFGRHAPWLAELERCSLDWPAAAAVYAEACRGLGDAALAERVALEAMRRFPEDTTLPEVARRAAEAAGDENTVTQLIEQRAEKGAATLAQDFARLVRAGSDATAARWLRERAPQLARSASQWRGVIRELWRQDLTRVTRDSLTQHATDNWEAQVVLAEAALLEGDKADARARFRAVMQASGPMLGSAVRQTGNNKGRIAPLYLAGRKLGERLSRAAGASWQEPPRNMEDRDDAPMWEIQTLMDARDMALVARREMALKEDSGDELVAELRAETAEWPAGERLLAAAIARSPVLVIESLEKLTAGPPQDHDTEELARLLLQRAQATPWLAQEEANRLRVVAVQWRERPSVPMPKNSGMRADPWSEYSLAAFNRFREGKFDEAERQLHGALKAGQMPGFSPDLWAMFFNSLIEACPTLGDREADGYATVLRWMAIQTVLRVDWPKHPDATMLLEPGEQLQLSWQLIYTTGRVNPRLDPVTHFTFANVNGALPDEQRSVLQLLVFRLRRADLFTDEARRWRGRMASASLGLSEGIQRQLRLYEAITLAGGGLQRDALREMLALAPLPLGETAALLAIKLLRERSNWEDDAAENFPQEPGELLQLCRPPTAVGRTGFLAAEYSLATTTDQLSLQKNLEREAHSSRVLRLLRDGSKEGSPKLRLMPVGRLLASEPVAAEVPEALRHLLEAAEIDAAVSLARRALQRSGRALAFWTPAYEAARASLKILAECGELGAWVSGARERMEKGPDSQRAAEELIFLSESLQHLSFDSEAGPRRDPLLEKTIKDVQLAADKAREHVSIREVDKSRNWQARLGGPPVKLAAELREALAKRPEELPSAGWLVFGLPSHPELNAFLADYLRQRPLEATEIEEHGYFNLNSRLLGRGMEESAVELQKRVLTRRLSTNWTYLEATNDRARLLAARGDRKGCAEAVTDLLVRIARPAAAIGGLPPFDDSGAMVQQLSVVEIFERAKKAGILPLVREMLNSRAAPFAAEIADVCDALESGAGFRALQDRIAGATPVPSGLLVIVAQLCANNPAGHEAACDALASLEPCKALLDADTFANCAAAGARAGYPRAGEWIRAAARRPRGYFGSSRLEQVVEGAADLGDERLLTEVLEVFKLEIRSWYQTNVVTWLHDLATRGKTALFDRLRTIAENAGIDIDVNSDGIEAGALQARAAYAGNFSKLSPILWRETHPDQNGVSRMCGDLGWWRKRQDQSAQFCSPGASWQAGADDMDLELFWGETREAMKSIARIKAPIGAFEAKLPAGGYVATVFRSGDGAQMSGATQIVPIAVTPPRISPEFPKESWCEEAGGPAGHFLRPIWPLYSRNLNAAQKPCKVITLDGASDVAVAAWLRRGCVRIELVSRDGAKLRELTWFNDQDSNWIWHELRVGANGTADAWGGAEEGGQVRVYVDPAGDVGAVGIEKIPRAKASEAR